MIVRKIGDKWYGLPHGNLFNKIFDRIYMYSSGFRKDYYIWCVYGWRLAPDWFQEGMNND